MPRIRTIKPDHWNDKQLPTISLQAHLLWIGTWNFSDDKGIFENDPLLIKAQIFPRRTDVRLEQVQSWLDQLVKARYIVPFTHNGEGYFISRTFQTHQRIDKPQPSKFPDEVFMPFLERSENVPRTFQDDSLCISKGEESIVKEGSVCAVEPHTKRFAKPDVSSVLEFFLKNGVEEKTAHAAAENFYDHYESNGWRVGRNPMKDWEAAARNWKKNLNTFKNGSHQSAPASKPGTSEARVEALRNF